MQSHFSFFCLAALLLSACGAAYDVPDGSPITAVNYVGATVSDLDRTAEFYTAPTHAKIVQETRLSGVAAFGAFAGQGVSIDTKMLRGVNAQIRYMEFSDTSEDAAKYSAVPVNGPGIGHICFQVNAQTRAYQKFLEAGAKTIGHPGMVQLSSRNPVEYAYIHDPDGLVVEVEHVDVTQLDLETPPKNDYRIRHVSLATPDMKRAVAFYAHLLGQPKPRQFGRLRPIGPKVMSEVSGLEGTKVRMAWFQLRNLELEIIEYVSHPPKTQSLPRPLDAVGYNMIVFDVTDLADAKARFTEAGGTLASEAEALDGGQIIFGRDPDGNLIGLQYGANEIVSSAQFKDNGI